MITKDKLSASRIFSYLFGLMMLALGISSSVVSSMGAMPGGMMPSTMNLILGMEFGLSTAIWMSFLVLVQILIQIKQFTPWILLQFVVSIVFGWFNSFGVWFFGLFPDSAGLGLRVLLLVFGIVASGFGIWLYSTADIMNMPSEGISRALSDITGKPFHTIKVIFDVVCVVGAAAVCWICLGYPGEFGLGTILNALLNGTVVGICAHLWDKKLFTVFDRDKTRLLK